MEIRTFDSVLSKICRQTKPLCCLVKTSISQTTASVWIHPKSSLRAEDISVNIAALGTAHYTHLSSIKISTKNVEILISTSQYIIALNLNENKLVGAYFEAKTLQGVAKRYMQRICSVLQNEPHKQTRITKIIAYLFEHSPNKSTAKLRLSLKTGIALADLEQSEEINTANTTQIEQAVCEILGLNSLPL